MADQKERRPPRKRPAKKRTAIQDAQARAAAATKERDEKAAQEERTRKNAESVKRAQATSGQGELNPQNDDKYYEAKARAEGWDTPESIAAAVKKLKDEDAKKADQEKLAGLSMLDVADRVTANVQKLQAAEQEKRALANPKNYGQSDLLDRYRASRDATEKRRLQMLQKQGKGLVYLGPAKAKPAKQRYGEAGDFAQTQSGYNEDVAGQVVGDNIADDQSLMGWLYNDKYRNMILGQAKKAGLDLDPNNFEDLEKVWTTVLKRAAVAYQAGQKVTPWAIMGLMAKAGEGKPYSRTTTQTDITDADPASARRLITEAARQFLGQDPSEAQIDDFIARAQLAAAKNPRVTQTTTQYDAAGQAVSSASHTSGGLSQDQLLLEAEEQAKADPNYAEYQAVGTYMPALFDLLGSAVD